MGTWTRPNNRSSVVIDGMTFNIGDLMGAGLDPFDNLSSRAVMDALARHNQAKNIFNLNPLFLGTRPEDTYQEEVVDLNADTTASNIPAFDTTLDDTIPKETIEPTSEPTPEQIYEENKKGTVFDLIDKYPTEDGGRYPVEFVVSILKNAANQGNANAAQILSNTPVAGPEGAFDGDGPAAGTGSAQQGTTGVGDLGDVLSGDDVVIPTNNTEPKVTGRRTEPKFEVATETLPPSTTPTVSTGSVLDQTGTGDVKVDDQPAGLLNIPTTVPQQPERKAGMIMQISQSAPIVETVFDDILFEPRFTRLDNIPDFNLPSGLLRTLV